MQQRNRRFLRSEIFVSFFSRVSSTYNNNISRFWEEISSPFRTWKEEESSRSSYRQFSLALVEHETTRTISLKMVCFTIIPCKFIHRSLCISRAKLIAWAKRDRRDREFVRNFASGLRMLSSWRESLLSLTDACTVSRFSANHQPLPFPADCHWRAGSAD